MFLLRELLENYSFSDNIFENYSFLLDFENYSILINFENHFSLRLRELLNSHQLRELFNSHQLQESLFSATFLHVVLRVSNRSVLIPAYIYWCDIINPWLFYRAEGLTRTACNIRTTHRPEGP